MRYFTKEESLNMIVVEWDSYKEAKANDAESMTETEEKFDDALMALMDELEV